MIDIVEEDGKSQSACRFLTYNKEKLYVVDVGLAVDSSGTMMVVDSKNHRLQLVDINYTFCGIVQVDHPLVRPSGIVLDHSKRELFVSNYGDQSVVCYKI